MERPGSKTDPDQRRVDRRDHRGSADVAAEHAPRVLAGAVDARPVLSGTRSTIRCHSARPSRRMKNRSATTRTMPVRTAIPSERRKRGTTTSPATQLHRLVEVPVERHVEPAVLQPARQVVETLAHRGDELVVLLHDRSGDDRDPGPPRPRARSRARRRRRRAPGRRAESAGERRRRGRDRHGDDRREHDHAQVPEQGDDRSDRRHADEESPGPACGALEPGGTVGTRVTGVGFPGWRAGRSTSCS